MQRIHPAARSRLRRAIAFAFAAALALVAAPRGLRAEDQAPPDRVDEIEERLKLAQVTPLLRERVHAAIARGVGFLLSQQEDSGRIVGRERIYGRHAAGYTALGGLALAHAGGERARRGAQRTLEWLTPTDGRPHPEVAAGVYEMGVTAMLLRALRERPDVAAWIVETLAYSQSRADGWWGYRNARDAPGDLANLSTTQFGALGLWAASSVAEKTSRPTWRRHLEGLLQAQLASGGWSYLSGVVQPMGTNRRAYPSGTFMGLANFELARAALQDQIADDPLLAARVAVARRRALDALDRDGPLTLDAAIGTPGTDRFTLADYYVLYALEKACVFTGVADVGGRLWYETGAGALLAKQKPNGSWGTPARGKRDPGISDVASTSFALLFLLRGSEVYRPVTPRDVPGPEAAVTGSPSRPDDEAPPAAPPVTLDEAEAVASDLATALDARRADWDDVERAVRQLADALARLESPSDDDLAVAAEHHARSRALRARAEDLQVAVLATALRIDAAGFDAAVIAATEALDAARPQNVAAMRAALQRALRRTSRKALSRGVLRSALGAIARGGTEDDAAWLSRQVTTRRDPASVRTSRSALDALRYARASGRARARICRTLVGTLEPLARAADVAGSGRDDLESETARQHLAVLEPAAVLALTHLATDSEDGSEPSTADGRPLVSVEDFDAWLGDHTRVAESPWRDAE